MKRALVLSLCLLFVMSCNLLTNNTTPETVTVLVKTTALTIRVAPTITTAPPSPTAIEEINIVNATVLFYDIVGTSEQDLRKQMTDLGPVGYDKYKGDAMTRWQINWNWPGYGTDSCDLSAATVSYEINVTFPRWLPPENADTALIAKWTSYTQALAEHEQTHVDFVVTHYPSVLDAIQNATCETADAAALAALDPIRQLDVDFDADTNYGATQGASFP